MGVGTRDWGSGIRDYVGRPYCHCPLPMIRVWVEGSGIRDQESGVRMAAPSPLHPNPLIKTLILHHNIARALGIWRCKLKSVGKTQGWNNNSRNAGSGRTGMASQIFRPHRPRLVTVGVQGSATSAGAEGIRDLASLPTAPRSPTPIFTTLNLLPPAHTPSGLHTHASFFHGRRALTHWLPPSLCALLWSELCTDPAFANRVPGN